MSHVTGTRPCYVPTVSDSTVPACLLTLLWDVEPDALDLERDRSLVIERVMARGGWDAMQWLRARYSKEVLADFVRCRASRCLAPRELAYWSLVCGVDLPQRPGGGRPAWAGP